jgi:UDP-N-acetylmuramate: L-alanyl-gamma-D-glutamyl-meso-diaminopimelate ligase
MVCKQLEINSFEFTQAISSFTGASKRLELLAKNDRTVFYRDFAHAPSKVKATIDAVKNQFPDRRFIAALELHTYSSLNEAFMKEYKGAMDPADDASVFYSKHALEIKRMPELPKEVVQKGFGKNDLEVFNERSDLEKWLNEKKYTDSVVVFMSSGNYDGLDTEAFAKRIIQSTH